MISSLIDLSSPELGILYIDSENLNLPIYNKPLIVLFKMSSPQLNILENLSIKLQENYSIKWIIPIFSELELEEYLDLILSPCSHSDQENLLDSIESLSEFNISDQWMNMMFEWTLDLTSHGNYNLLF